MDRLRNTDHGDHGDNCEHGDRDHDQLCEDDHISNP